MMLKCKQVSKLLSQGLDRRLGFAERLRLRVHLSLCDGCTHFYKQIVFLRKAMANLGSRSDE